MPVAAAGINIDNTLISITLPWPPSANTYWRRRGNTYFITPDGISYRKLVMAACFGIKKSTLYEKRLSLFICAFPPDKRRRDLDNLFKCLLDSLQHANVYKDDSQIDCLYIKRMPYIRGELIIKIEEINLE